MVGMHERMKSNYEDRSRFYLTRRTPVVIRVDGRAFHTYTKKYDKPFSEYLSQSMNNAALKLCEQAQGAICAYVQSDEISVILKDYDHFETQAWFDYNLQKIVSVSASIVTGAFNAQQNQVSSVASFDARAFNIPESEVCNYLHSRQVDWYRNSVLMLGQSYFSHKELMNKSVAVIRNMLIDQKDVDWANLDPQWKYGRTIIKRATSKPIYHSAESIEYNNDKAPEWTMVQNRAVVNWAIKTDFQFSENRDEIDKLVQEKQI